MPAEQSTSWLQFEQAGQMASDMVKSNAISHLISYVWHHLLNYFLSCFSELEFIKQQRIDFS